MLILPTLMGSMRISWGQKGRCAKIKSTKLNGGSMKGVLCKKHKTQNKKVRGGGHQVAIFGWDVVRRLERDVNGLLML